MLRKNDKALIFNKTIFHRVGFYPAFGGASARSQLTPPSACRHLPREGLCDSHISLNLNKINELSISPSSISKPSDKLRKSWG